MPNVFEVLSNDHEQVRRMLTEFEAGVLKAAGPAVAAVDRARDPAAGRGQD